LKAPGVSSSDPLGQRKNPYGSGIAMMKRLAKLAIASLFGLSLSMSWGGGAEAMIAPFVQSYRTTVDQTGNSRIQDVAYRRWHGQRGWRHRYHGGYYWRHCYDWGRGCRRYHGGYWYGDPWWVVATPFVVGAALVDRPYYRHRYYGGSRHVRWCLNRYRSYNPRTNTWITYSGDVRVCVSPY
jgi:BA14K-like protein